MLEFPIYITGCSLHTIHSRAKAIRKKNTEFFLALFPTLYSVNYNMLDTLYGIKCTKVSVAHFIQRAGKAYDPC